MKLTRSDAVDSFLKWYTSGIKPTSIKKKIPVRRVTAMETITLNRSVKMKNIFLAITTAPGFETYIKR